MGKFSLEHKIKDRLEGHEVHIDKRELWKSLGIEEEEKDRKVFWMWWFAGLLGLAITTGLWWYVQKDELDASNVQKVSLIEEVSTSEIDKSLTKTGNETIADLSASEKLSTIIDDVKSGQLKATEKPSNQNNIKSTTRINKVSTSQGIGNESTRKNATNEETLFTLKDGNESIPKKSNLADLKNAKMALVEELYIDELPLSNTLLTYDRDIQILEICAFPMTKPIKGMRKFEFELYGGIGTINRDLSTANRDYDNYIAGRDSSESTLEHVSLGASLKYIIGGGFYGKAGIGINRWNEKYSYDIIPDTTKTAVPIPDVILIDLQGSSTTTFVEGTIISYNNINWVRYNRLTQIDLPLSLGYEQRFNKWSLFGEAAAIINMKQMFTGYLNTLDGQIEKDPDYFKSSVGLNLGFNAGVGYGITPRIRARVSARYYRSLNSVLKQDFDPEVIAEQKYTSVGIRVGIGYLF